VDLNPLLARELEAGARRWPTYALRMGYLALLLLGVWVAADLPVTWSAVLSVSRSAQVGRDAFTAFALIQFWAVTLHAILVGADLFAKEIRADTLGLLALTLLSPADLVRGKWMAAVVQSATLMFCGLPVLAACAYLGGPDALQVVAITVATLSSLLLAAAISVNVSAGGRGMYSTTAIAVVVYGFLVMLAAFPASMLSILGYELFRYFHPVGTLVASLGPVDRGSWLCSSPLSLFLTWIVLEIAGVRICGPEAFAPRQVRASKEIVEREEYFRVASENLGRPAQDRPVWDRFPLLWKEIRTRAAAHVSYQLRLVVLGSLALIVAGSPLMDRHEQNVLFLVYVPLAILITVAIGSGLFTRDRDQRRWEAVLGTPATTWSLILAKLASGPCSPEGATAVGLAFVSTTHFLAPHPERYLQVLVVLLLFFAFSYAGAALASLLCRSQRTALLLSAAAVLFVLLGFPWLSGFLRWDLFTILHPYTYFSWRTPSDEMLAGYILSYAAATSVLIGAVAGVFRRIAGRS